MRPRLVHVVDDDPRVRETLIWMLEAVGFLAQAHTDPGSVPVESGDCVILDERLGENKSGLDGVDPLTGHLAGQPVVLLTGCAAEPETRRRAREAGVRHVLGKPAQIRHLVEAVQAAMAEVS